MGSACVQRALCGCVGSARHGATTSVLRLRAQHSCALCAPQTRQPRSLRQLHDGVRRWCARAWRCVCALGGSVQYCSWRRLAVGCVVELRRTVWTKGGAPAVETTPGGDSIGVLFEYGNEMGSCCVCARCRCDLMPGATPGLNAYRSPCGHAYTLRRRRLRRVGGQENCIVAGRGGVLRRPLKNNRVVCARTLPQAAHVLRSSDSAPVA